MLYKLCYYEQYQVLWTSNKKCCSGLILIDIALLYMAVSV